MHVNTDKQGNVTFAHRKIDTYGYSCSAGQDMIELDRIKYDRIVYDMIEYMIGWDGVG